MRLIRYLIAVIAGAVTLMVGGLVWADLPVKGRIVKISGSEAISRPYSFEVEIVGRATKDSLALMINEPASFRLPGGRMVVGVVREARNLGRTQSGERFLITVGPRLAELEMVTRSRMFNELSSVEILQEVLDQAGLAAQFNVSGTPSHLLHSTQFDESDLNYLHRVMEAEGLFYLFQHSAGGASMVVADGNSGTPVTSQVLQAGGRARNLQTLDIGVARAGLNRTTAHGSSRLSTLSAGHRVRIEGSTLTEANQSWLVTEVAHSVDEQGAYGNTFSAVPAATSYEPAKVTPRSTLTSAFGQVTGPAGEEIQVDEYGRIQVALPWTAPGAGGTWMRVLQPNSDSLWLPRVGEEVLVAFEYGDPDRPYVVGSAFNAQHMPPFALPQLKAVRRLGSKSSPGGGGVNELFFGDVANQELLHLGAARDLRTVALNNHHSAVGNDFSTEVSNDVLMTVGGRQQTTIDGSQHTTVGGHSRTQAGELVLEGTNRIVLRVGPQQLVIDANGVHLPQPQPATSTNTTPQRIIPRDASSNPLKRPLK